MPREVPQRRRRQGWFSLKILMILALIVVVAGGAFYALNQRSPITYQCNLPPNQLFDSVYPNAKPVTVNRSQWMQPDHSDPALRMDKVMDWLANSGGNATAATGQWITQHPQDIRFWNGLIRGNAMAVTVYTDTLALDVGLTFMDLPDNVQLAVIWGHETIHYIDASENDALGLDKTCEEMRAFAFETLIYAEFRERGYRHPNLEEGFQLLSRSYWNWQTKEWAEYVKRKINY